MKYGGDVAEIMAPRGGGWDANSNTRKSSYFGEFSYEAHVASIANLTRLSYLALPRDLGMRQGRATAGQHLPRGR